jgi:hypothetical protein
MSVIEDVEKLMWEVERRTPLYKKLKEYSDRNLKDKLFYDIYMLVVTNWSELPAEQKSEKCMLIFLFILLGIMVMMLIYWAEAYIL